MQKKMQSENNRSGKGQMTGRKYRSGKKRRAARVRAAKRLAVIFVLCCALLLLFVLIYRHFSYSGLVRRGYKAMSSNDTGTAEVLFEKAIDRAPSRGAAYEGLADLYIKQGKTKEAETMIMGAVSREEGVQLYRAAISFFEKTKQKEKIARLMEQCDDEQVRRKLNDYICAAPAFSLKEGKYEEVQQVSLSAEEGETIYYTTDGSSPTEKSDQYTEPILLGEGKTVVSAVAYNKNGIPSVPSVKEYDIALPPPSAPNVTPVTGEYEGEIEATVQVPSGCKAYYTLDQSDPDASSTEYQSPVKIKKGQTIMKVILVSEKTGQTSEITTRNYICK